MSFVEQNRTTVEQEFITAWTVSGALRTPIAFETVEKSIGLITTPDGQSTIPTPPSDGAWVRVTLRHQAAHQTDMADHPRMRHTGLIIVDVFCALKTGSVVGDQLVDDVLGIFERGEFANLRCFASVAAELPQDESWYHQQVTVPFYADRLAA